MSRRSKVGKLCRNCNKLFFPCYSSYGFYCSVKCQKLFENKKMIKSWLDGLINPINSNGLLRPWARRYLFEKNNNKCSFCGWSEVNENSGKIPLEVDHVDGNSKNNVISNLRLLCPNCHSLTSTYKNLNRGRGRNRKK